MFDSPNGTSVRPTTLIGSPCLEPNWVRLGLHEINVQRGLR